VRGFGGSDSTVEEMRRTLAAQGDVVRAAAERGVTALAGTDAGMGPHGQVATEIGASETTVKVHRAQAMKKMQAQSLPDLVRMAERLALFA